MKNLKSFDEFLNEANLTDFIDKPGKTEIWYSANSNFDSWSMRKKFYSDNKHKEEYIKRYGEPIDPMHLEKTHVLLGSISETNPDKIYSLMNGWGMGNSANNFLKQKGVTHTSMSVGDIIKIGHKVFFVDDHGFKDITNESLTESINEGKTYKVEDFKVGDLLHFNDGEVWKVVKPGLRASNSRVKSDEITIFPENKLAKDKNVSMSIDVNMDYLNKEIKKIEKK